MKLTVLEKSKGKMVLEVRGEDHTFLNLLKDKSWKAGSKQASYIIEHPNLSEPKLIVRGKDPKKILQKAAQMVSDEAKDFEKELKRVLKK